MRYLRRYAGRRGMGRSVKRGLRRGSARTGTCLPTELSRLAMGIATAVAILAIPTVLVGCSGDRVQAKQPPVGSNVLIHFDRADYDRADEFVRRFAEGRGDLLYAVVPTLDSGPIVYDLRSDGKTVFVREDTSRDNDNGSEQKQTLRACRGIEWTDGSRPKLTATDCEGIDENWSLFGFDR